MTEVNVEVSTALVSPSFARIGPMSDQVDGAHWEPYGVR